MPFYEQNYSLRTNATSKNSKVALITGVTGQVGSVTFRSNVKLYIVSINGNRSLLFCSVFSDKIGNNTENHRYDACQFFFLSLNNCYQFEIKI